MALSDMYRVNEDGSYAPFETAPAATQSNTIDTQSYADWLLSQRPDANTGNTAPINYNDPNLYPSAADLANYNGYTPVASTPDPLPNQTSNYTRNSDGSYAPFETAVGDSARTADGGYVNNVIPQQYVNAGSLIQTAQQMGVNPSLYGALNLQASYAPEYQNVPNVGNMSTRETPNIIDLQSGQVDTQTPLQQANAGYLSRLASEQSDPVKQMQSTQNQQAFNSMMVNSPIYNPGGANTYAIQHNVGTPAPLFTENAPNPYNPGGTVENPTTQLPPLASTNTANTNTNSGGLASAGMYDEYGFGKGPKYNQWDGKSITGNKVGGLAGDNAVGNTDGRRPINFGRALWR